MNIKNILLISFFLFVLPSLIVFSVETIFYTDVKATSYDSVLPPIENISSSSSTVVAQSNTDKPVEPIRLNKVDKPHPLKYSHTYSTQNQIVQLNKKEEVKKEEKIEEVKPLAHPQVAQKPIVESNKVIEVKNLSEPLNQEKGIEKVTMFRSRDIISYSNDELDMVAKIIHAEAGNGSYEGKVAIGSVILNRLQSNSFANSIEGVVLSKNQFSAVVNGSFKRANPTPNDYEAAIEAFNGFDPTGGALYYYSPSKTKSNWHETLNYLVTIDGNRYFSIEKIDKVKVVTPINTETVIHKQSVKQNTKLEYDREFVPYSEEDVDMLAKIIHAEAKGESYEGKVAVGAVVINRLQSNSFADTLEGVIFAKKQFEPIENGSFAKAKPTIEDYEAAIESFNGVDPTGGATFFYAPKLTKSSYHESLEYLVTIGSHRFFSNKKASN